MGSAVMMIRIRCKKSKRYYDFEIPRPGRERNYSAGENENDRIEDDDDDNRKTNWEKELGR
jgi:hypothetical protein